MTRRVAPTEGDVVGIDAGVVAGGTDVATVDGQVVIDLYTIACGGVSIRDNDAAGTLTLTIEGE